jgi:hypothetical protein
MISKTCLENLLRKIKDYQASLRDRSVSNKEAWKAMSMPEKVFMISIILIGIGLVIKGSIMIGTSL